MERQEPPIVDENALVGLERDFDLVLTDQLRDKADAEHRVQQDIQLAEDLVQTPGPRRALLLVDDLFPGWLRLDELLTTRLLSRFLTVFVARTTKGMDIVACVAPNATNLLVVTAYDRVRGVGLAAGAKGLDFLSDII